MANDPTTDTALNPFFGTDLDRAKDVLDWLWDHRDDVMDLANRLPKILEAAGQSMSSAGDGGNLGSVTAHRHERHARCGPTHEDRKRDAAGMPA
jgi:hypothetical protein